MKDFRRNSSSSQRIKYKRIVTALGLLLLLFLLFMKMAELMQGGPEPVTPVPEPVPPHIPVIRHITNVWIMEQEEGGLLLFEDGRQERYPFGQGEYRYIPPEDCREQLADIELTDGAVTGVTLKKEKINDKILSAGPDYIETKEYGRLALAPDHKGYRIYHTLEMCTVSDIAFGYSFTDLVVEDGVVCGLLLAKEEAMEDIRVLIRTGDYAGLLHQELRLTCDGAYQVEYGSADDRRTESFAGGEEILIGTDSAFFDGRDGKVIVSPKALTDRVFLKNVHRNQGIPGYKGCLELTLTEEGIAVVNELPLETYLYSVVPSEMPASYPREALKAQAVCARTYAYGRMLHAGYPAYGAHVDDSTSYQVYNNIAEQEAATTAVKETYGQLLYTEDGEPAETYYYSTSCGVGSTARIWKTKKPRKTDYLQARAINRSAMEGEEDPADGSPGEYLREEEAFAAFIKGRNEDDFEAQEGWYRWSYQVEKLDAERICETLRKRYEANAELVLTKEKGQFVSRDIRDFEQVRGISVEKRGEGGVADELILVTERDTIKVISEYNIRCVLDDGKTKVRRQDGSTAEAPTLLPSGFFVLETGKEGENVVGYSIWGGGYGHGVGMSQNGAKAMAKSGYGAEEILHFFYTGCRIFEIYKEPDTTGEETDVA